MMIATQFVIDLRGWIATWGAILPSLYTEVATAQYDDDGDVGDKTSKTTFIHLKSGLTQCWIKMILLIVLQYMKNEMIINVWHVAKTLEEVLNV